jgi:hypothetical protein
MQGRGFEPLKALSQQILSLPPLTAREPLQDKNANNCPYKKLYKHSILGIFENDHNSLETPNPIPNLEVKLAMLLALVFERK